MNGNPPKYKDFLGKPAPAGYIAGLGRGAAGFMTRPDIGPAKDAPLITNEDLNQDEEQFDENEAGLLGGAGRRLGNMFNDPEDDEADRIYAEIDTKMADRRRTRREKQEELEEKRQESLRPKTQLLFADLKRDLSRVSEAEWASLPEVGDFRAKRLKRSGAIENPKERFLPVPDSVHSSLLSSGQTSHEVQDSEATEADFVKIGEARGKLLGMHLDQLTASNKGSSSAGANDISMENQLERSSNSNPNISLIDANTDIGDLKRARQLFASIIRTNKKNPSGWISAARLELQSGNQKQARALILKGCEECSKSEEIWFEAIKMHENVNTLNKEATSYREILAKALKSIPESVNLWMLAVEKETDTATRRKILRSALERNSKSAKLWMSLVELEDTEEDARLLLSRAVECAPDSVDLWLALARLQESTQSTRQVLNRARVSCPTSFSIWINAARLEEANDATKAEISKIIGRGASELSLKGVKILFDEWIKEAEECEDGGDVLCAGELVNHAVSLEIASRTTDSDQEVLERVMKYARESNKYICAKTALVSFLNHQNSEEAWILLFEVMRKKKPENEESELELRTIYERALELNAQNPQFWINYARDMKSSSTAVILTRAISVLSLATDKIIIWRELIDFEMKLFMSKQKSRAEIEAFCETIGEDVELKKEIIKIYEFIGLSDKAFQVSLDQIKKTPKEVFFYISASRNCDDNPVLYLKRGLDSNPDSVELALKMAQHQFDSGDVKGAKLTLEKSKLVIQALPLKARPSDFDQLYAALCLLEFPTGNVPSILPVGLWPYEFNCSTSSGETGNKSSLSSVKLMLNLGLRECPKSEILWHMAVSLEPRQLRRSKVMEGLRIIPTSSLLHWTLSAILSSIGNDSDARAEISKALLINPANVDLMAYARGMGVGVSIHCLNALVCNYNGRNWKKFIESNKIFYFPSFEQIFDQFLVSLSS